MADITDLLPSDEKGRLRIIQETVPGNQISLAHVIGSPQPILYQKLGLNPDIDYEAEKALVDDGLFDSLEIMSIVMEINDRFHIDVDPEDVTAENFNSLEMMLKLIDKH